MGSAASVPQSVEEDEDDEKIRLLETRCRLLEEQIDLNKKSSEDEVFEHEKRNEGRPLLVKDNSTSSVSSRAINSQDEGIIDTYRLRLMKIKEQPESNVMELPRGSFYVKTRYGPFQFGIPPESIKCSMQLGLKVPSYFVVPPESFHMRMGLNLADIEFPAYFNFFLLQSKVHIILTKDQEKDIRKAFDETIEGPEEKHLHIEREYGTFRKKGSWAARPDLFKEMAYFKEPRNGRTINTDSLIDFIVFDENNEAEISFEDGSIKIKNVLLDEKYEVFEDGKKDAVAEVSYEQANSVPTPELFERLQSKFKKFLTGDDQDFLGTESTDQRREKESMTSLSEESSSFKPVNFGVTMLGTSHGFDSKGVTTGFIIWVHGAGIYVDPPPHADSYLIANGISPRLINKIILTHCHSDHDAGTFQKILKEQRIDLITTKTIHDEFVRKYALISDITEETLLSFIDFEEVLIDFPHIIYGATFHFFYSLHALPCIGFKAECGGKTLAYSGDTYYDVEGLNDLAKKGVISMERKQSLLSFPFDSDIVLHECGIPPIHTSADALKALPQEQQQNLYAVHVSDDAAEKSGLRKAPLGFANSLVLDPGKKKHKQSINILRALSKIEFFQLLDLESCALLLEAGKTKKFYKGQKFSGEMRGTMFIVLEGVLIVKRQNKSNRFLKVGDFFGELTCFKHESEDITLCSSTAVKIFEVDSYGLHQVIRNCPDLGVKLQALADLRGGGFGKVIAKSRTFGQLSHQQQMELKLTIDETVELKDGEEKCLEYMKLVAKGRLIPVGEGKSARNSSRRLEPLNEGDIFIPPGLRTRFSNHKSAILSKMNYVAQGDCKLYSLNAQKFVAFAEKNPFVKLAVLKSKNVIK